MSLGSAFKNTYSQSTEALLTQVCKSIENALWPWYPGRIIAWTEQEFALNGPKLTFEIELFPNLPFVAYPDVLRYDQDAIAYRLSEEAFKFYRYRPALPVDDHIVLGEE